MNDIFEITWLVLLLLFSLGEALTVGLTSIWFAAGALAALVCALLGGPIWLQIGLFLVVSVLCLLAVRPLAKVYQQQGPTHQRRPYSRHGGAGHRKHRQYPRQRGGDHWRRGLVRSKRGRNAYPRRKSGPHPSHRRSKSICGIEQGGICMPLKLSAYLGMEFDMGHILAWVIPILIVVLILLVIAANIKVVQQSKAMVVERLGAFHTVWGVGLHLKIPFIERIAKTISLKEQVVDFAPQPVITKDNVTMQIDTVIYFQITDPKLYTYGVEQPMSAIENLTATTLRNIIGDLELDQSLTSRDHINTQMRAILDEATDPWGIKVNRVELKNIMPPKDIQDSMEKQMRAERERREAILQAEGQKQSQILVAEGEKQSAILRADAAKQAAILEAEGKAQAILKVQQATADALKLLNEAAPNDQVVKLKALEAFQAAADGRATKIIIPSEIQGLAGLCASAKAVFDTVEPNKPAGKPANPPAAKL